MVPLVREYGRLESRWMLYLQTVSVSQHFSILGLCDLFGESRDMLWLTFETRDFWLYLSVSTLRSDIYVEHAIDSPFSARTKRNGGR